MPAEPNRLSPGDKPIPFPSSWRKAIRIALWYAGLSSLWILGSGWTLHSLVPEPEQAALIEAIKGWVFVAVTALLLAVALARSFHALGVAIRNLEQSEAQKAAVLDSVLSAIAVLDPNGVITAVNSPWTQVTLQDPPTAPAGIRGCGVGANYLEVCRKAAAEGISEAGLAHDGIRAVLEGRRPEFTLEYSCRIQGKDRWFTMIVTPLGADRRGAVVSHNEITARKESEAALRQSEERFRMLIERASDGIILVKGRSMTYASPSARRMIGMGAGDPLDLDPDDAIHLEDRPRVRAAIEELMDKMGSVKTLQHRFRRADGDWFWVESVFTNLVGVPGIDAIVINFRDITERKRDEEELIYRQALLDEMGRLAKVGGWELEVATGKGRWTEEVTRIHDLEATGDASGLEQGLQFYPGECRQRLEEAVRRAIDPGEPYDLELEFVSARGQRKWVRTIGHPVMGPAGVVKLRGSIQDITERREFEEALRASERQLRTIFDAASVGMAQADPHSRRLLRVNGRFCRMLGYSEAELLQMEVGQTTHPEDREMDRRLFEQVAQGELSEYHVVKRYRRKDGSAVWVSLNVSAVRDREGKPVRMVAFVEDITQRLAGEEERRRLAVAMDQAVESIVITDPEGVIVYVNPAVERVTGFDRSELLGQTTKVLGSGYHAAAFYRQLWQTLRSGQVWQGRFHNKRKDGTLFVEEATISPVFDDSGRIVNFVGIKLDVTHEMELENQFRQAQKMEAVGQLAGGVAHDFNNMIGVILMQSEMAAMPADLPQRTLVGLDAIRAAAERAARLTRQLLLFSRKEVMRLQTLDLNDVVRDFSKMLVRMIGENVELQLELQGRPIQIQADSGMLEQVLMNLAINARDAMPGGGRLTIKTDLKTLDAAEAATHPDAIPGPHASIEIRDTGTGMTPEVQAHIFEPFFTTKEAGRGTGLGLATVFGIVKQHRGWITVRSVAGEGTCFEIFLPEAKAAPVPVSQEIPAEPILAGTETILLVEDDASVRASTSAVLELNGYKVYGAANGTEALELWERHRAEVALLLTDLVMPGAMGGRELARDLRGDKPGLKIVYVSGYSEELAGKSLPWAAGERFLQKPFPSSRLLKAVRSLLDD